MAKLMESYLNAGDSAYLGKNEFNEDRYARVVTVFKNDGSYANYYIETTNDENKNEIIYGPDEIEEKLGVPGYIYTPNSNAGKTGFNFEEFAGNAAGYVIGCGEGAAFGGVLSASFAVKNRLYRHPLLGGSILLGGIVGGCAAGAWLNHTSPVFAKSFADAEALTITRPPIDPIILDLDGDGIETTTSQDGLYFDINTDGFSELTAWANSDDGVLALDRNGDNFIDTGRELFGDQTLLADGSIASNGYQALSELDTNTDGKIDHNDTEFANLKILKGDGTIMTMDEAGIKSIDLNYTTTDTTDENGNQQIADGSFTWNDDTTGQIGGFNFQTDITDTIEAELLEVPAEIQALPDVRGFGKVYSLHQAMVRDTSGELQILIESFINETDAGVRGAMPDIILFTWTGNNNVIMFDKYYIKQTA